jgi:hypothetical protein
MVLLAVDKEHAGVARRTGNASFPASMDLYRRFNICRSCEVANQGGDLQVNGSIRSGVVIVHG